MTTLRDENGLRDQIETVIADWVVPGIPPAVIAQNVIDELGLEVETTVKTYPAPGAEAFEGAEVSLDGSGEWNADLHGLDVSAEYTQWVDSLPQQSRIIGPYEVEER